MLSCTANIDSYKNNAASENQYKCEITEEFLYRLLKDIHTYNHKDYNQYEHDSNSFILKFELLNNYYFKTNDGNTNDITLLEKSLMCYWEAYICFRLGNDFKKAAGSLKKILRTIQKYIKLDENDINRKVIIGKYLNEIKNRILKQCLINIYSYYNYINIIEIQKIKWIFYVQMYESISLNRLSLFPDIEEIMLVYYDILSSCIIDTKDQTIIEKYIKENYNIEERNKDLRIRLSGIYRNVALGTLRHESTIYERVLSLQFKTIMNQRILEHLFTEYSSGHRPDYFDKNFYKYMIYFLDSYLKKSAILKSSLKEYEYCFRDVFSEFPYTNINDEIKNIHIVLSLLEFLIKDSMYCLTRILEIITPYTSTTLFTHTFLGDIYQMLFKWNQVFDVLFMTYRASEKNMNLLPKFTTQTVWETGFYTECPKGVNNECIYFEYTSKHNNDINISNIGRNKCPYYNTKCIYKLSQFDNISIFLTKYSQLRTYLSLYKKHRNVDIAEVFFNDVLKEIGKSNIHYTLSNYSVEMSLKSYRQALDMHHEGKSYKETVSKMYYLDDDLKNDTIQFDLALERFRINNGYIERNINRILKAIHNASIYDVENFCCDNETLLSLENRFKQNNNRE